MHTEPQDSWAIVLLRSQESGSNAGGEEHTARMHSALHFLVQQIFSVRVSCLYR